MQEHLHRRGNTHNLNILNGGVYPRARHHRGNTHNLHILNGGVYPPTIEDSTLADYRDCVRGASELPEGLIVAGSVAYCSRPMRCWTLAAISRQ
jgi:hypothetical protein